MPVGAPAPTATGWSRAGSRPGEYPGAKDPREAARKLRTLLAAGIDHFVDLTEPHELVPYAETAAEEARGLSRPVEHERRPVADLSVPGSTSEMAGILDAIDGALEDGRTVYLHCWGGVGRTGTVVGCWLVRHGRTGDEALKQLAEWWQASGRWTASPVPGNPGAVPVRPGVGRAPEEGGHRTGSLSGLPPWAGGGGRARNDARVQVPGNVRADRRHGRRGAVQP